jgi:hypothetical protein
MEHLARLGWFEPSQRFQKKLSKAPTSLKLSSTRSPSVVTEIGSPPPDPDSINPEAERGVRRAKSPPAPYPPSLVANGMGPNAASRVMAAFNGRETRSLRNHVKENLAADCTTNNLKLGQKIFNLVTKRRKPTNSPLREDAASASQCQDPDSAHVVIHPLDDGRDNFSSDPEPIHSVRITRKTGAYTLWKVSHNSTTFVESFLQSNKECKLLEATSQTRPCDISTSSPRWSHRAEDESSRSSSPRKRRSCDSDGGSPTKRQRDD